MAPANLQGLNVIHPVQNHSNSQDLIPGQSFPDLSAQLDLWTNLAFDSDEGPLSLRPDDEKYSKSDDGQEESRSPLTGEKAIHDGHVNVVTGTNIGSNQPNGSPTQQFDLNSFLAGFGIDPFATQPIQQVPPASIAPSLAQLLALHAPHASTPYPASPPHQAGHAYNERSMQFSHGSAPAQSADETYPAAKRSRSRKTSVSFKNTSESFQDETDSAAASPINSNSSNPLSAAEDKRRRNTAASARFRLKKKEREAALEGKAKELETRVNELERECEGLRRENGWLKGLVVGVTGAAQGPVGSPPTPVAGSPSAGTKRSRDESNSA